MNAIEPATASHVPAPSRRRVFPSTYLFTAAVALLLFLSNVPGQIVAAPSGDQFPDAEINNYSFPRTGRFGRLEHGWPFTYLWRSPIAINDFVGPGWRPVSLWNLSSDAIAFRWTPLIADLAIAAALIVFARVGFQFWRRRRAQLWRFSLAELMIVVALIGAGAASINSQRSAHRREARAIESLEGAHYMKAQPASPSWLRAAIGEAPLSEFDRIV
jgi:hypothetical protein